MKVISWPWLLEKRDSKIRFLVFGNDKRVPEEWLGKVRSPGDGRPVFLSRPAEWGSKAEVVSIKAWKLAIKLAWIAGQTGWYFEQPLLMKKYNRGTF